MSAWFPASRHAATLHSVSDSRDVVLGLALIGVDIGTSAGRAVAASVRLAGRVPYAGGVARRLAVDLAHQGSLARARLDARTEAVTAQAARVLAERVAESPRLLEALRRQTQHEAGDDLVDRTVR
jgi:hypothetical protein